MSRLWERLWFCPLVLPFGFTLPQAGGMTSQPPSSGGGARPPPPGSGVAGSPFPLMRGRGGLRSGRLTPGQGWGADRRGVRLPLGRGAGELAAEQRPPPGGSARPSELREPAPETLEQSWTDRLFPGSGHSVALICPRPFVLGEPGAPFLSRGTSAALLRSACLPAPTPQTPF